MSVSMVSIWWPAEGGAPERFSGSGLLLDATHVLTAAHVLGGRPAVVVRLVPGRGDGLLARLVQDDARNDVAVLAFAEGEATGPFARPRFARRYVSGTQGQRVAVHAISPASYALAIDETHEISNYDTSYREYELTPAVPHGYSGGAAVHDGVVLGLLVSVLGREPLARAKSTHAFCAWLDALVPGLPGLHDGAEPPEGPRPPGAEQTPEPGDDTGAAPTHGLSHEIDSIHLHVDGARRRAFVRELVRRHREAGLPSKSSGVADFVRDRQRDDDEMRETYAVHTPGSVDAEDLDFFSTTQLSRGAEALDIARLQSIARHTNDILVELDDLGDTVSGMVVELERVVAAVAADGSVRISDKPTLREGDLLRQGLLRHLLFSPFNDRDQLRTQPRYEYHFSIDVAREEGVAPPELELLQELAAAARLPVGGWFRFQDADRWAFRSNGFGSQLSVEQLRAQWRALREQLDAQGARALKDARLRLLAEELLAVWRTPLVADQGVLTVSKMAQWERTRPELEEFWVILPNFLGDRNPRVMAAMAENLGKDVRYVHFLRSHADAKRWLEFRRAMSQRVERAEELMQAVVVGTTDPQFWLRNASFIANPPQFVPQGQCETGGAPRRKTEGLRLIRTDPVSDQPIGGIPMHESKLDEIVAAMRSVLRGGMVNSWHVVAPDGSATQVAAVCMKLACDPDPVEFDLIDTEFAYAASGERGEVANYGRRSISLVFEDRNGSGLERALRCVRRMQDRIAALVAEGRIARDHQGRFGIDTGAARKVVRAMAPMWSGAALVSCREVLARAPERAGVFLGEGALGAIEPVARRMKLSVVAPAGGLPAEAKAEEAGRALAGA